MRHLHFILVALLLESSFLAAAVTTVPDHGHGRRVDVDRQLR